MTPPIRRLAVSWSMPVGSTSQVRILALQTLQPTHRRRHALLLEREMSEQVFGEPAERVGEAATALDPVVVGQRAGALLDLVEMHRDVAVVGLEPVDDRADSRI